MMPSRLKRAAAARLKKPKFEPFREIAADSVQRLPSARLAETVPGRLRRALQYAETGKLW
jgi:hypothetical protein